MLSRVFLKQGNKQAAEEEITKAEVLRKSGAMEDTNDASNTLPVWIAPTVELESEHP